MIRKTLRLLLGAFAALVSAFSDQAYAHPHVWVTANSEIVYSSEGAVISVRHHWSFKPPGPVGPFGAPPLSNRISVNCP